MWVLPSSETKIGVQRVYQTACKAADKHPVSYLKFLQIWGQFYPYVVISKPMTDLCITCQQNTNKLQRAANLSERKKVECIRAHQDHINSVQSERDFYRTSCANSQKTLETDDTVLNCANRKPVHWTAPCTTYLITHNKCTSQAIPYNQDQFTSKLPKNAGFSGWCARQFHNKSTF